MEGLTRIDSDPYRPGDRRGIDNGQSPFAELDGFERVRGPDITSGAPDTELITIRGRDPGGEPMCVTLRCDDFQRIVEAVRKPWHLDAEASEALAAYLVLQEMAGRGC